jgi:tetratricopeptide (TPR) repeat protein
LYRRALEASERVLGPEHPHTLTSVNNLAVLLRSKGDNAGAEPLYRRALEARERVLGPEHPNTLKSVNNLALLLNNKGDHAGAEPLYRRALEAKEKTGQGGQPQFALDLNNHALLLRRLKRFDEAATLLQRAIGIEDRYLPPDHPKRAHRCNNLAIVRMLADQLDEARHVNAGAWSLKASQHDVTSGRILFTRIALCWLRDADASHYLGQLRTLLAQPELPCLGGIDRQWQAADILDHLCSRLPPEKSDLLAAVVAALNEHGKVADLERFDLWHSTLAVPLEVRWPDDTESGSRALPAENRTA